MNSLYLFFGFFIATTAFLAYRLGYSHAIDDIKEDIDKIISQDLDEMAKEYEGKEWN